MSPLPRGPGNELLRSSLISQGSSLVPDRLHSTFQHVGSSSPTRDQLCLVQWKSGVLTTGETGKSHRHPLLEVLLLTNNLTLCPSVRCPSHSCVLWDGVQPGGRPWVLHDMVPAAAAPSQAPLPTRHVPGRLLLAAPLLFISTIPRLVKCPYIPYPPPSYWQACNQTQMDMKWVTKANLGSPLDG